LDFQTKVNKIIMNLSILDKVPLASAQLKDDLGFDSLKLVELILAIEDGLSIEIDESDLDPSQIMTVDDLYKLIKKYSS